MDDAFRVSVVTPTFQRGGLLRRLLQSLALQRLEHGRFELIIADDGSGVEVSDLAKEFGPRFSRLVYITGPNSGPGVARNRGAGAASSPVLAFIDSDCAALSGWIENITSAIEGGADLAHGPVRGSVPPMPPFIHSFRLPPGSICTANFAISRQSFDQLGGFDQRVSWDAEDREFFARCASVGLKRRLVSSAAVLHIPQLRNVRVVIESTPRAKRVYESQRAFLKLVPEARMVYATENRRLLLKGLLKIGILGLPAFISASYGPVWAAGYGLGIFYGVLKGLRANWVLRSAGETLRVPFVQMVKYGLLFPFLDLLTLAERARGGMGLLRG